MSIAEKLQTIAENEQRVYEAGKTKGIEEGKKSEYDRFWDDYQQNGNRTTYSMAFGGCWTANNFHPKYSMRPKTAFMMFYDNMGGGIKIDDFVTFCEENNVALDFSQCTNAQNALAALRTYHHGVLDFSKCTAMNTLFYSHNSVSPSITTIDEWISTETTTYHSSTFQHAVNLTNITFSGVIATGDFNVSYCTKLTHDSLMSIINHLKDGVTSKTVTLGSTNLAKLGDAEKAIATTKGWTLL
jgi:hypothetical protein